MSENLQQIQQNNQMQGENAKQVPFSNDFQQVYSKDNELRQSFYKIDQLPTEATKRESQVLKCPSCNIIVRSEVEYKGNMATLILSGFLLVSTGILAPLPFLINKTRNCIHSCPKCNTKLGKIQWLDSDKN